MMKDMCGINYSPLVLGRSGSHFNTTLAGYVNAHRTFGAIKLEAIISVASAKGAKSRTLGTAQGILERNNTSATGA